MLDSSCGLHDELNSWLTETERLLWACERLVQYFGSEEEERLLLRALVFPRHRKRQISALAAIMFAETGLFVGGEGVGCLESDKVDRVVSFAASEAIAGMLTPLLVLVSEPIPDFVATARATLMPEEANRLVAAFGHFSAAFADNLCVPLWRAYPALAPEGWPL